MFTSRYALFTPQIYLVTKCHSLDVFLHLPLNRYVIQNLQCTVKQHPCVVATARTTATTIYLRLSVATEMLPHSNRVDSSVTQGGMASVFWLNALVSFVLYYSNVNCFFNLKNFSIIIANKSLCFRSENIFILFVRNISCKKLFYC